jgi:thymidylate synthase
MKNNTLDPWYQSLLSLLVSEDQSFNKSDRTGTGTKSLFGVQFRHDMSDGFPLLTTKKMAFKTMVTELLWFLKGDTNIKFLIDNDCHIWDGDCFSNYLKKRNSFSNKDNVKEDVVINGINGSSNRAYTKEEFINKIKTDDEFAKRFANLGPIYGKQWRRWKKVDEVWDERLIPPFKIENIELIDQISNLINELKTNPDSRRLMVSAWNVGELDQMVLPPCHYGFQMYTRELNHDERFHLYVKRDNPLYPLNVEDVDKHLTLIGIPTRAISLMWNQRSCDTFLGLPFNIASYGLLLMMIADEVNMVPDQLIGNLGDVHLYNDHVEQAKEQIGRTPFELPTVHIRDGIESFMDGDIILKNYQSHPSIKAPLSN